MNTTVDVNAGTSLSTPAQRNPAPLTELGTPAQKGGGMSDTFDHECEAYDEWEREMRQLKEENAKLTKERDELLKDATTIRKIREIRNAKVGIGCCCEFDEDGETPITWCGPHAAIRDENAKLKEENAGLKEYSESRDESIKVYREEIKEQAVYIHQLRGALGYPVPGDIPNNIEVVNGIAEALNKLNDELRERLKRLVAFTQESVDCLQQLRDENIAYQERLKGIKEAYKKWIDSNLGFHDYSLKDQEVLVELWQAIKKACE